MISNAVMYSFHFSDLEEKEGGRLISQINFAMLVVWCSLFILTFMDVCVGSDVCKSGRHYLYLF